MNEKNAQKNVKAEYQDNEYTLAVPSVHHSVD